MYGVRERERERANKTSEEVKSNKIEEEVEVKQTKGEEQATEGKVFWALIWG